MRPSSLGGGRILRRTLSVRLSVCPSVPISLPSVTSRNLANYNNTCTFRHALRAAYRTAISTAQILVLYLCRTRTKTSSKVTVVDLYSASTRSVYKAIIYSTHCQGITHFYPHTLRFIRKLNEPLPLPSQPQMILIYRPRRDGRLNIH